MSPTDVAPHGGRQQVVEDSGRVVGQQPVQHAYGAGEPQRLAQPGPVSALVVQRGARPFHHSAAAFTVTSSGGPNPFTPS